MSTRDLAPGLLLASTQLGDPNFDHTVVLLARHDDEGALGWVVNGRPLASVRELLRDADLVPGDLVLPKNPAFDRVARVGGPVSRATGWILYRRAAGVELPGALDVGPDLAITGDADALAAVIRGEGPEDFRLLLGYAGWGPGQVEAEVRAGAWLPADLDARLLLDTEAEKLWNAAYQGAIGVSPAAFTSTRGGSA